jgi:hypothetical protein
MGRTFSAQTAWLRGCELDFLAVGQSVARCSEGVPKEGVADGF